MPPTFQPSTEIPSPITELQQILSDAGDDIGKIFGPALSVFAGPFADTKTPKEKHADIERLITGNNK